MFEKIRSTSRYVVNGLAFAAAVMTVPELGTIVPSAALPQIVAVAAVLNTVLSLLRRF